jgi:hypothetical protein
MAAKKSATATATAAIDWKTTCFILLAVIILLIFILVINMYRPSPPESSCVVCKTESPPPQQQPPPTATEIANSDIKMQPFTGPVYGKTSFFQQIGHLTNNDNPEPVILPLFGKMINSNRWIYYTVSDKQLQIKIDIEHKNKSCQDSHIGCDELYNDDEVFVPAYSKIFKISMYKYAIQPTIF